MSLNGSYATGKGILEIVRCLDLPGDLLTSLSRQKEDNATIPKFLYYLQEISVSLLENSDGRFLWSTSEVSKPSIQPLEFAKLARIKYEYPYIFKVVPRALLDDFKSTITHESPSLLTSEEELRFEFKLGKRASRPRKL